MLGRVGKMTPAASLFGIWPTNCTRRIVGSVPFLCLLNHRLSLEFSMSSGTDSSQSPSGTVGNRPEELPPVSPPSAGFIVQLFLIPALIVMAVVAVWALFGKLADSESNWQQLVTELGSSNDHRRWRAALGIAQLLRNEEVAAPTDREPLATNPLVIDSLTELFRKSLVTPTQTDEDITNQEFLARTLSTLRADEKTLPPLAEAMKDTYNVEVRKSALMSVGVIAGRHFDEVTGYSGKGDTGSSKATVVRKLPVEKPTITDEAVLKQLRLCAQDPLPVVRHLAGFALASVSGEDSLKQLKVMLLDGDRYARANAAIGLARNGSTECVPTLIELLNESLKPFDSTATYETESDRRLAENSYQVEQPAVVRNCLRATLELWPQLNEVQKTELKAVVSKVATEFFAADVKIQAAELLKMMDSK